jgi:hypothetical protein
VRLLIDEMWAPAVAVQIRQRGHDAVAVGERADLRGQPDEIVFAAAQAEGRAVVTENVVDYRPLAARLLERGRTHAGLILTTNNRFPRHDPRTPGRLVMALHALLSGEHGIANQELWLQEQP